MHHSSRRNPCPVCFRDTDDKCRWNDHSVLCYFGNSFHPPEHLLLGDFILIGEEKWKLIRTNSGFAANSYLFVKSNDLHLLTPLQRQRVIKNSNYRTIDIKDRFYDTRNLVFKSLSVPEFQRLKLQEFMIYKKVTHNALDSCENLLSFISSNKGRVVLRKFTVESLGYWRKRMIYHLKDFLQFEINKYGVINFPAFVSNKEIEEFDW